MIILLQSLPFFFKPIPLFHLSHSVQFLTGFLLLQAGLSFPFLSATHCLVISLGDLVLSQDNNF